MMEDANKQDQQDNRQDATTAGNGGDNKPEGGLFTQEELNRIASERAARAKQAAINELLGELGLKSTDELSAFVKAHKEREEAEMSELEKAQRELEQLRSTNKTLVEQRKRDRLEAAVLLTAKDLGFADPYDALAMLDTSAVEVTDDGEVRGHDTALKELAKIKPYLINNKATKPDIDADKGGKTKPGSDEPSLRARYGL